MASNISVADGGRSDGSQQNLSDWMGSLDECLLDLPLNHLAIPGSHNSFTYTLSKDKPVGPDQPQEIVTVVSTFGVLGKSVIHNWSRTQSLGVTEQLEAGIRYFDVRLASESTNDSVDNLYVVHGLYGPNIWNCLTEIESFMNKHPTEVVLLDFRKFYNFSTSMHESFLDRLIDKFSSLMCPILELSNLTLRSLHDLGTRLIVFYHNPAASSPNRFQIWPEALIDSPWPNVTKSDALLTCLDRCWETGQCPERFHVTQGILTPDTSCIVGGLCSSLKSSFAESVAPKLLNWVEGRENKGEEIMKNANGVNITEITNGIKDIGLSGDTDKGKCNVTRLCKVNICIADFIELSNFSRRIVELNKRRSSNLKTLTSKNRI